MNWRHLKVVRRVVSFVFVFFITLLFLDFSQSIPPTITAFFTSLQLIPSLVVVTTTAGMFTVGVIVVLSLTLLFGRVYCSTLCPLGTYQDFVIRISRIAGTKRWFRYRQPFYASHYAVLTVITIAYFSGSLTLLNLLEPFSNYGRMVNTFLSPVIVLMNNAAAILFGKMHLYILVPLQQNPFVLSVFGAAALLFAVITTLAFTRGRIFCNLLCPAGALLGLVSRFAVFKMAINTDSCTHCKLCEKVCKAECIDSSAQRLEAAACVGCFNCMDACHTDGVVYRPNWTRHRTVPNPVTDIRRRGFLRESITLSAAVLLPLPESTESSTPLPNGYENSRKYPVTPPGSGGADRFSSLCTACQLCVSACPTHVLQPAWLAYGAAGILQPRMDYAVSFCNYDCAVCTHICPTGAILPLSLEEKKRTQIGKTVFVKDDCIVITKKKDCGACAEHCPTKAVRMIPHDGMFLPEVRNQYCTGCGACEHACPTIPRKAIFVDANPDHLRAEKPETEERRIKERVMEEFPF